MFPKAVSPIVKEALRRGPPKGAKIPDVPMKGPPEPDYGGAPRPGTRVRVQKGDVPSWNGKTTVASARGRDGVVDGAPFESLEGKNKGKTLIPVKDQATGQLMGVPVEDVLSTTGGGSHSRARVGGGGGPAYAESYRRIFGHD